MSAALKVTAEDSLGNVVVGFTGNVTVALFDNPGPGTLSGTKTQPATAGVATFSNLTIDRVGNGYTLIATANGLVNDFSASFNIIPGPAARLVFTVQPSSAPAASTISPPVEVTVADAKGNTVTGYGGSVTIAIGTNPSGGTLFGTTTQPVSSGVATFSNLSIDLAGTGYTLQASSGALTNFISASFFISF